jgi:hypothetical protein
MTPHQIVVVCLRLLAVAWLLTLIGSLYPQFAFSDPGFEEMRVPLLIYFFLQLIPCVVLWFFPATLATKLLPSPKNEVVSAVPTGMSDWATLGFLLIGVWGLSSAVPNALYWIVFIRANENIEFAGLSRESVAGIVATGARLAISLWLVLGAKGIGAILWKIRTGGIAKS